MTVASRLTLCLFLSLPIAAGEVTQKQATSADGKVPIAETRTHYVLRTPAEKVVQFEVTVIRRSSEEFSEQVVLVNDVDHGRVLLETKHSFGDQNVFYAISDVKREDSIRASFKMPYTAKTRTATLREIRQSPTLKKTPSVVTVTTGGGEWGEVDTTMADWSRLRELRRSIRPTISFYLLESIERMRGAIFSHEAADLYYPMVARFVVYQSADNAPLDLEEAEAAASCDFDRAFGYPCSKDQLKKLEIGVADGKPLSEY
jgi:hypothetical protein